MRENVDKFFALMDSDSKIREQLDEAIACYPGCLDIRDAMLSETMLPLAKSLGLEFTLSELRAYETKKKLYFEGPEMKDLPEGVDQYEAPEYWLISHGWDYDTEDMNKISDCQKTM